MHDVVAHLGGITADIVAGNVDGAGTDGRAAAQVAAREHRGSSACSTSGTVRGPVEAMVDQSGDAAGRSRRLEPTRA